MTGALLNRAHDYSRGDVGSAALWTTRRIDTAVAQLHAEGHETSGEDIARLSPLKHRNLNPLGRYSFRASAPAAAAAGLRPGRPAG